jgi:hypothetical protein
MFFFTDLCSSFPEASALAPCASIVSFLMNDRVTQNTTSFIVFNDYVLACDIGQYSTVGGHLWYSKESFIAKINAQWNDAKWTLHMQPDEDVYDGRTLSLPYLVPSFFSKYIYC